MRIEEILNKVGYFLRDPKGGPGSFQSNQKKIGDEAAQALAQLIQKEEIHLSLTGLSEPAVTSSELRILCDAIIRTEFPVYIDLRQNNLGDAEARQIASVIERATVPVTFNLCNNQITHVGLKIIASALKKATNYVSLCLPEQAEEVIVSFAEAIKKTKAPVVLDFSFLKQTAGAINALADAIKNANTTISLSFGHAILSRYAVANFALAVECSMAPVKLKINGMDSTGLLAFSEAIKRAKAPISLDLGTDEIHRFSVDVEKDRAYKEEEKDVYSKLAEAIKIAPNAVEIKFSECIPAESKKILSDAVTEASSPIRLIFPRREWADEGNIYIEEEVKTPSCIEKVSAKVAGAFVTKILDHTKSGFKGLGVVETNIGLKIFEKYIENSTDKIILDFKAQEISLEAWNRIAKVIEEKAKVPVEISPPYHETSNTTTKGLEAIVRQSNVPVTLSSVPYNSEDGDYKNLAGIIKSTKNSLTITMSEPYNNKRDVEELNALIEAADSMNVSVHLKYKYQQSIENTAFIVQQLEGNCWPHLSVELGPFWVISRERMEVFAEAIKKNVHIPMHLDLKHQDLDEKSIDILALIVEKANAPVKIQNFNFGHGKRDLGVLADIVKKATVEVEIIISEFGLYELKHKGKFLDSLEEAKVPICIKNTSDEIYNALWKEKLSKEHREKDLTEISCYLDNPLSLSLSSLAPSWFESKENREELAERTARSAKDTVTFECRGMKLSENVMDMLSCIVQKSKHPIFLKNLQAVDVDPNRFVGLIEEAKVELKIKFDSQDLGIEENQERENKLVEAAKKSEVPICISDQKCDFKNAAYVEAHPEEQPKEKQEDEATTPSDSNNDDDKPGDSGGGGAVLADKKESKPVSVFLSYEPEFLDIRLEEVVQNETKEEREYRESLEELEEGLSYEAQKAENQVVVDIEEATEEALPYIQDVPVTKISGWLQLLPEVSS